MHGVPCSFTRREESHSSYSTVAVIAIFVISSSLLRSLVLVFLVLGTFLYFLRGAQMLSAHRHIRYLCISIDTILYSSTRARWLRSSSSSKSLLLVNSVIVIAPHHLFLLVAVFGYLFTHLLHCIHFLFLNLNVCSYMQFFIHSSVYEGIGSISSL